MTTRLYSHPVFLEHLTPPGHPERPDRLRAIGRLLEDEAFAGLERVEAPRGEEAAVVAVHPSAYLEAIRRALPESGLVRLDADTTISPKSLDAALTAVGGATAAVDSVFAGTADNAFLAARPPGHHAETRDGHGLLPVQHRRHRRPPCAAAARRRAGRDRRLGRPSRQRHAGDLLGRSDRALLPRPTRCRSIPAPARPARPAPATSSTRRSVAGSGGDEFREAFRARVLPALDDFRPDLIIVSAGFDAHHRDPLASINLTEEDFDWATGQLLDRAAAVQRQSAGQRAGRRL